MSRHPGTQVTIASAREGNLQTPQKEMVIVTNPKKIMAWPPQGGAHLAESKKNPCCKRFLLTSKVLIGT